MISDKPRRKKSREVNSRYLSPPYTTEPPLPAPPSPINNRTLSPNHHNAKSSSSTKNRGFIRGIWPSSTSNSSKSQNESPPTTITNAATLADYLGNERRKFDVKKSGNSGFLSKQRSCSEFTRFENNPSKKNSLKENHKPIFSGGSMRYTGKLRFSGHSSDFLDSTQSILPGRLSVDENALHRRSSYSQMKSDSFSDDSESTDLGSPFTGKNFPASYMSPTLSSKNSGVEVPSKYMNINNSPKRSSLKTAMKRANSLTLTSKWGTSPVRSGSPPATSSSFSSSKPPTSPSWRKKNFLHMGLDLIKGKKGGSASGCSSPLGSGHTAESVHKLRIMHNSLMQWRYANVRAELVQENIAKQAENSLLCAKESMTTLQKLVLQKRLQLEKEKLEMKLNFILHSQIMLEAWGDMERRHTSNVTMMKDGLQAVVCSVPLIEGAKADPQSTSIALCHASDLAAAVKSMLSFVSPMAHETAGTLSKLAEVAAQEKLLLQECFEHFSVISTMEIKERSLRRSIIEMNSLKKRSSNISMQKLHEQP